jgi:hypothetical protein
MRSIKRGTKMWQRCDSVTKYMYDMNVCSGKETTITEGIME